MVTFILDNDREQKINAYGLPQDKKASWVGLYCYDEESSTMYFFGDDDYVLVDLRWVKINLEELPDFFGLENEFTIAKQIIINP